MKTITLVSERVVGGIQSVFLPLLLTALLLMAAAPLATFAASPVTGISLNESFNNTLTVGGATDQLTAIITPVDAANQGVTWLSSDSSVATVSSSGLVTAVGLGLATITVTTDDGGFTATDSITVNAPTESPAPLNLLSAANFTILSETGITDTGSHSSMITGNIGSSPITAAAMNDVFCSEITGTIYGVDAAYVGSGNQSCFAGNPPAPDKTLVDNAVLDMGTAYTNAAGLTNPTATELGAGNIGGMTLAPGLYKWSTGVTIPTICLRHA